MATQKELDELQDKIYAIMANKSATKKEWLALLDEYRRIMKTCDPKKGGAFGWENEGFIMLASCYEDD